MFASFDNLLGNYTCWGASRTNVFAYRSFPNHRNPNRNCKGLVLKHIYDSGGCTIQMQDRIPRLRYRILHLQHIDDFQRHILATKHRLHHTRTCLVCKYKGVFFGRNPSRYYCTVRISHNNLALVDRCSFPRYKIEWACTVNLKYMFLVSLNLDIQI